MATLCVHLRGVVILVSIHATLAGGDAAFPVILDEAIKFLSTPPSRVATPWFMGDKGVPCVFLSTPPSRVATETADVVVVDLDVSIHATLAGGDEVDDAQFVERLSFYPRHPRGWRHLRGRQPTKYCPRFYPRHPRGWRLSYNRNPRALLCVSIHATLAGGDQVFSTPATGASVFLSTPPSRVATNRHPDFRVRLGVSIHATLAGGDRTSATLRVFDRVSIHATLAGGDIIPMC